MRIGVLVLAVLCGGLCGASCLPLVDDTEHRMPGNTFAVSVDAPTGSRSVPLGTKVQINWSAANLTDFRAKVRILVESRDDLHRTEIARNLSVSPSGASGTVTWDTADFAAGPYAIVALMANGEKTASATSAARITIDVPPEFEFGRPTDDVTFTAGDLLRIHWIARDRNGTATARIGLDPDEDHTSGNEIILHQESLTADSTAADFNFTGIDIDNHVVPHGSYLLYAELNDQVNPISFVDSVTITIE